MIDWVSPHDMTWFEIGDSDWFRSARYSAFITSSNAVLNERVNFDKVEKNAKAANILGVSIFEGVDKYFIHFFSQNLKYFVK